MPCWSAHRLNEDRQYALRLSLKEADDYITLHTTEFTDRAASAAHASRIRGDQLSQSPDESNLKKLKQYQTTQMTSSLLELQSHANANATKWRELAELTMSCLLVFNVWRGSEAAELMLQQYAQATSDVDSTVSATFNSVELQLLNRYFIALITSCWWFSGLRNTVKHV